MKDIRILSRACGICKSNEGFILHEQKFIMPEGSVLPSVYSIVACKKCGFVFADMEASQEVYELHYSKESIYETEGISIGGNQAWEIKKFNEIVEILDGHFPERNAKILDVGCATGGLLNAFKKHGYVNLHGVDPSEKCVLTINKSGFTGYQAGIFSDIFPRNIVPSDFDCVILSHVLEHIYDIEEAIERILQKLKVGGVLYIEVPDAARYLDFYKSPYYFFENEHINHFDIFSLKNLLRTFPLQIIGHGYRTLDVSSTDTYPAFYLICRKQEKIKNHYCEVASDFTLMETIERFIQKSKKEFSSINREIEKLYKSKEKILIWGAGNNTYKIFANTKLRDCNIISIIDKDLKKQGQSICGIVIGGVKELENFDGTIIVSSILHSRDIVDEIRTMGLKNKIVVLK